MLNLLVIVLLLQSVKAVKEEEAITGDSFYYSGLAKSLADFFHCPCINFITESKFSESLLLQNVIKEVSQKYLRSTNVYNFTNYQHLQNMTYGLQCQNPLQVVFSNTTITKEALIRYTHYSKDVKYRSLSDGVWLLFLPSTDAKFVEDFFTNIRTLFHAQTLIAGITYHGEMELKEVYRVAFDFPLHQVFFGHWSKEKELQTSAVPVLYYRRNNLEGLVMKAACFNNRPFSYTKVGPDGEITLSGYMGDIWKSLQQNLNFTSEIETYNSNMEVINRTVVYGDVGIAEIPLSASDTLKGYLSFSVPIFFTTLEVYYQHPGVSMDANAQFLPLSQDLWLSLLIWLFVATIFLYVGCYLSDRKMKTEENLTFSSSALLVAGALCAQASNKTPKSPSCRVLYMATFLITAVIIPSYSASLISYLTFLPTSVLFSSMKEFYEMGTMRLTVEEEGLTKAMLSNGDDAREETSEKTMEEEYYFRQVFHRDIKNQEQPANNSQGLQAICRNRNLAYFGMAAAMDFAFSQIPKNDRCLIAKMPYSVGKVSLVYIYPWKSHYRKFINHNLRILINGGVLRRFSNKYWPMKARNSTKDYTPVGLVNVFMVFVILALGVLVSLLLFIVEYRLGNKKKANKMPWNKAKPQKSVKHH